MTVKDILAKLRQMVGKMKKHNAFDEFGTKQEEIKYNEALDSVMEKMR